MIIVGPVLTLVVLALAFWLGGRAEREAAGVVAVALVVSLAIGLFSRPHDQFSAALADVVLLGGFVFLAARHRRGWLYGQAAVAIGLVTAQLSHDDLLSPSVEFRRLINSLNLVVLGVLLAATVLARGRSRRGATATPGPRSV